MPDTGKDSPGPRVESKSYPKELTFANAGEAAKELKIISIGTFFEANNDFDPSFGLDVNDGGKVYSAGNPHENFIWTDWVFLPKPLKMYARNPNHFREAYPGIYVFHYPLNKDRFKKAMEKDEETERYFREQLSVHDPTSPDIQKYRFDAKTFLLEFNQKFSDPSCIFTNLYGGSLFVGNKEILQRVMNFLKTSGENTSRLLVELGVPTALINNEIRKGDVINLYDLAGKQKDEVHYQLE